MRKARAKRSAQRELTAHDPVQITKGIVTRSNGYTQFLGQSPRVERTAPLLKDDALCDFCGPVTDIRKVSVSRGC